MNLTNYFITSLAAAALFVSTSAQAARLTPTEALKRVETADYIPQSTNVSAMRLVSTVNASDTEIPAVYVFSSGTKGGSIFVSADDSATPLLGYTDCHISNDGELAPALRWWLGEYGRQMECASASGRHLAVERPSRQAIAPMISTQWSQDDPYNLLCPKYNGKTSMTGCVATAMAQVMKYHNWPSKGEGSNSYYYKGEWLTMDFSTFTPDWNNMLDSYANGAGNERQKIAIARLMQACGYSVNMQYSPAESGAPDVFVASALADYFGYDRNIRYAERDYFGMLEWEDFIYDQLKNYGPVQYSGSSTVGGHSFVCDGYEGDGYFHINWGWAGVSDGFFRLSALDPEIQGIGGSTSGFNFSQAVIANIRKPKLSSEMYLNLMMDQGFTVVPTKTTSTRPGDKIEVNKRVVNYSIGTASGSLGVKFTNDATGAVKYGSSTRFVTAALNYESSYTTQIPSSLTSGTYTLTPVFCGTDGVWRDTPVKLSANQKVIMTIKNGVCTFENARTGSCRATEVELHTPVYLGNLFRITATVTNEGDNEFVAAIVPTLASGNMPIAKADQIPVDIMPGESTDIDFEGIFNHFASSALPPEGKYTLYLVVESTNEIISDGLEVDLHGIPEDTQLTSKKFELEGDAENADPAMLRFTGEIECSAGYFGRNLTVVIFPADGGDLSSTTYLSTSNMFIGAGESATFTAQGAFPASEPGKEYFAVLFDGQTLVSDHGSEVFFTIAKSSALSTIEAGETVATYIYDLSGRIVNADEQSLPAGFYIVEKISATGERSTERIVRRR